MKRKLLFGFLLLAYAFGNAQFQVIDDPAFEDELIRLGHDSNPIRDGGILISDAEAVTFLNLTGVDTNDVTQTFTAPGLGIINLTGIKAFTNLEVLWAQQNDLVELDLEGMTTLTDIRAFNNNLARINIKGLVNLDIIGLNNNSISGINVSTNTSLRQFDIAQNNLLYLDISGLSSLTEMNVQNNSLLGCVQVESAARATALNGNTNFRKNGVTAFSNTCTPIYTQIPDRNFESALLSNGMDTEGGIPNGLVLTADISDEFNLDISNQDVTDLTGLEAFSVLEILNVSNNNLNAIRLQNVSLIEIYANNCNLAGKPVRFQNNPPVGSFLTNVTTLELQNNNLGIASSTFSFGGVPNVQTLNVSGNNFGTLILGGQTNDITNLIASNCPNLNTLTGLDSLSQLQELTIDNSNFTTLDFSGLDLLSTLRLNNNNFSSLNLKPIDDTLTTLNTTGNANLSCIEVNNVANAEAQVGWQKDGTTEYLFDCNAPQSFEVFASIGGDVIDTSALVCCPEYEITEGQRLDINFNADPTAPLAEAYIVRASFSGDADANDFSVRESSANQEYVYTVKTTDPDNILQIDILNENDGLTETDEVLRITLTPVGDNFTLADPQVFEVTIKPVNTPAPFQVTTNIQGVTGTSPNFEITEGTPFTLNFESSATAPDGTQYIPNIQFTLNGNNTTADFTFNGTTDIPNTPFTVSSANPDGSITILAEDEGAQEGNETYTITISSPDPSLFTMTGQTSFEVTVRDRIIPNTQFGVTTGLEGTQGFAPFFKVSEGNTFELTFNADDRALNGTQFDVRVTAKLYDIVDETVFGDPLATDEASRQEVFQPWNQIILEGAIDTDTSDYLISVNENDIDEKILLQIIDDDESELPQELILTIDLLNNDLQALNTLVYIIKIFDNDVTEINPIVSNAGTATNYIVQEGESFTISTSPNTFFKYFTSGSALENIDYNAIFENNILNINTLIDGQAESDEKIKIELIEFEQDQFGSSELNVWAQADSIGRRSLEITLQDTPLTSTIPNYSIALTRISNGVRSTVTNFPVPLEEGDELEITLTSDEPSSLQKGISFNGVDINTISLDYSSLNELNAPILFDENYTWTLTINNDTVKEENENLIIEVSPTTSNYVLLNIEEEVIPVNTNFNIPIEILDDDEELASEVQAITTNVANGFSIKNNDPFVDSYSITKDETIEILLNGLKNGNEGETYTLGYQIPSNSTLTESDYEIIIEDENGRNLQLVDNKFNLTVIDNNTFDAKISINIDSNISTETIQKLYFILLPDVDVTIDEFGESIERKVNAYYTQTTVSPTLEGSLKANKLNYEFLVIRDAEEGIVNVRLSNSGGIEGSIKPDVIKCELLDSNLQPFTSHTSIIRIPTEVNYNVGSFPINPWELVWENTEFVFEPGQSTATINVRYLDERESAVGAFSLEQDKECNYYYLELETPDIGENSNLSINLGRNDYLVKVVDKHDFLVFVDIDPENVYPVIEEQIDEDELLYSECIQCISKYIVEEGKTIKFTLDAANGVDIFGNNTGNTSDEAYYLLDLKTNSISGKSFALNRDARWDFGDVAPRKIFIKNGPDKELLLEIRDDNETDALEQFTVSFDEPSNEKQYRFSKRNSFSYDKTFRFIIVEPLVVDVNTTLGKNRISEGDPEELGEIIISLNKAPQYDIPIKFELKGLADFGINNDYLIESENYLEFKDNQGIIYFKEGQTSAILSFRAIDDPDDEEIEETIQLDIINDFGYRGGNNQTSTVTILDNDSSTFSVSISSNVETIWEDVQDGSERVKIARIEFLLDDITTNQLGDINDTVDEIQINFNILEVAPFAGFDEDFYLFEELESNNLREITPTTQFVRISPGEDKAYLILEARADDVSDEGNEKATILLATGENYSPNSQESLNMVTVFIRDGSGSNNSNTVTAAVINSSCVGETNGRILMTNDTNFAYNVSLYNSNNELVDGPKRLETPINEQTPVFEELASGEYTVLLDYALDSDETRPENMEPPSFKLRITDPGQIKLLNSKTNSSFKQLKLTLGGSSLYTIKVNQTIFSFKGSVTEPTEINVPLLYGDNQIEIKGEKNCQESITKTVYLDPIIPYPNPSSETLFISGYDSQSEVVLEIFELTGRRLLHKKQDTSTGTLSINVKPLSKGLYILKVTQQDGSINQFKISKK